MQSNLNYILEEIIGEGAMAVVYKARHRDLDSHHAIKKLKIQDFDIQTRLIQEGKLLANIRHPNILSVTDLVKLDGIPSLVMEYIQGPSLAAMLSRFDINERQADALGRGMMKGVMAAHKHGLIHRDLKPGNILIDIVDGMVVPKVADFGLAKILHSSQPILPQTRSGVTMGTPAYMAPEQIKHFGSVDERADIFSLGIILYEVITGKGCFTGVNTMEIWEHICNGKYVLPEKLKSSIPPRMRRTIEKALLVDREARFSSVEEMLECWCTDEDNEYVPLLSKDERDFWPKDLLERMLVDKEEEPEEDETRDFSQQVDIAPLLNMAQELNHLHSQKRTSPSVSMHNTIQDDSSVSSTSKQNTMAIWGILMVGVLALGVIFGRPTEKISAIANHQSVETVDVAQASLLNPFTSASKPYELFEQVREQLLIGEYYHASSLIRTLSPEQQQEPAVIALRGMVEFLRGDTHAGKVLLQIASKYEGPHQKIYQLDDDALQNEAPLVLVLFCLSKWSEQEENFVDALVSYQQSHPTSIVFSHLELRYYRETGSWKDYNKKIQQFRDSSSSALQMEYVLNQSMKNPKEVEERLMLLQKKDASNVDVYLRLANFFARQGAEASRTKQFMMSLGDTIPPQEQMTFISEHATFLASIGQISEAEKLWNFCLDDFDALDLVQERAQCALDAFENLYKTDSDVFQQRWMGALSRELSSPYLPAEWKFYYSMMLSASKAKKAIHSDDINSAQLIEKKIMEMSDNEMYSEQVISILRLLDLERFLRIFNQKELQEFLHSRYQTKSPTCEQSRWAASIAQKSGLPDLAQKWREDFLKNRCAFQFPELFIDKVQIHFELASSFADKGDTESAKEHLSLFFGLWSEAEEQIPLYQKAQKLSASLGL